MDFEEEDGDLEWEEENGCLEDEEGFDVGEVPFSRENVLILGRGDSDWKLEEEGDFVVVIVGRGDFDEEVGVEEDEGFEVELLLTLLNLIVGREGVVGDGLTAGAGERDKEGMDTNCLVRMHLRK